LLDGKTVGRHYAGRTGTTSTERRLPDLGKAPGATAQIPGSSSASRRTAATACSPALPRPARQHDGQDDGGGCDTAGAFMSVPTPPTMSFSARMTQ
jgi:hypothetical protein